MIQIEGLNHSLSHAGNRFISNRYKKHLAQDVVQEISSFFTEANKKNSLVNPEIIKKKIHLDRIDRVLNALCLR